MGKRLFATFCTFLLIILVSTGSTVAYAQPPVNHLALPSITQEEEVEPPELQQAALTANFSEEYSSDEIFDATGGNLGTYLGRHELPDGRYIFEINMDRWYSPLITKFGHLDATTLDRLIQQKILPEAATLMMQVYDVDHEDSVCPEVDHIYINGELLQGPDGSARLTSGNETTDVLSFDVPTRLLKFAKDPGNTGERPEAINTFEIDVNVLECGIGGNDGERWRVRVDWARLALPSPIRPIVLIHGWTSNPGVWSEDDNFIGLLNEMGVPYATPIGYEEGVAPTPRWIRLIQEEVDRVRTQFGVDQVNLIGHSRGGLVARLALEDLHFANKVETLVTLGSPHHGTNYGDLATIPAFLSPLFLLSETYRSALTMSRTYVRQVHNYRCTELIFTQINCTSIYKKASYVHYYSIAEGARLRKTRNTVLLVDDKEATYPWKSFTAPFPSEPNVDHTFENFDHSELARERESHCMALSYIAPDVTATGPCVDDLQAIAQTQIFPQTTTVATTSTITPTLVHATDATTYVPGADVTLRAALYDGTTTLADAALSGELIVPEGTNVPLIFVDDGSDGDEQAGDGVFTTRFTAPREMGVHGVVLRGVHGTFDMEALEIVMVAETTATLNRVLRTRATDTNSNRLYDELNISLQIRVNQTGHFRVSGELVDVEGQFVSRATYISRLHQEAPLNSGLRTIALSFDGREIRERGLNGPYTLANVTIYDETEASIPVYDTEISYQTSDYRATQFEGPLVTFIVGSDATTDTDGNNRYDELVVMLQFDTVFPGRYRWSGRLVDQRGREIGWASDSGQLDKETPITLTFDGKRIGNRYFDGPYTIRDLSLTQIRGGSTRAIFQSIYTTAAYEASLFERDPSYIYLPIIRR